MNNLKINKKPFAVTKHYSGTYTCDSQWEDEIQQETYSFTIQVTDYTEGETELDTIVWDSSQPRDIDAAELFIEENYLDLIES